MLTAVISSWILYLAIEAAISNTNNDCYLSQNEEPTSFQKKEQNEPFTDIFIKSGENVLISNSSYAHVFDSLIAEKYGRIIIDQAYNTHISVNYLEIGTLQIGSNNNCEIFKDFKISKTTKNEHVQPIIVDNDAIWIPYQLNDAKSQLIYLSYDIYGMDMTEQSIIVDDIDHMNVFRILAAKSPSTYLIDYSHQIPSEISSQHVNYIGVSLTNTSPLAMTRRRLPHDKKRRKSEPTPLKKVPVLRRTKSDTDLLRTAWAKKVSIYEPIKPHEHFKEDSESEKIQFVKKLSKSQADELHDYEEAMVEVPLSSYFKKSISPKATAKKHKSAGDKATDTSALKQIDLPIFVLPTAVSVTLSDSQDSHSAAGYVPPITKPIYRKVSLKEQMTQIREEWDRVSECIFEEAEDFRRAPWCTYKYLTAAGGKKDIMKSYSAWKDSDLKSTKTREHFSRAGMLAYNAGGMAIAVATLNPVGMTIRSGKIVNDVATYSLMYTGHIEPGNEKDTALSVLLKWVGKKLSKKEKPHKWRKERWWSKMLMKVRKPKGKGDMTVSKAVWEGVKETGIQVLQKAVIPAGALAVTLTVFPPAGGAFAVVAACALLTWVLVGGIVKGIYLTSQNAKEAKDIHKITGDKVGLGAIEFDMDDLPLEYRKRVAYMMQFPNSFQSIPAVIPKAVGSVLNTGKVMAHVQTDNYLNDYYISKDDLYDYDYDDFTDEYYNEREFHSNEDFDDAYYNEKEYKQQYYGNNNYFDGYANYNHRYQSHINYNEMKLYSNMLLAVFLVISVAMVICVMFTCICSLVISRYVSKYFKEKKEQEAVQMECDSV